MNFRANLFKLTSRLSLNVDGGNNDSQPWDPQKYHRAFVAGLLGFGAATPGGFADLVAGNYVKGALSILAGFIVGFTVTLANEYGLRSQN